MCDRVIKGVVFLWMLAGTAVYAESRPNILWLTIEDTSAYEFGCYGNRDAQTPNVDALAKKGIQFMKAWSTAPHCSPARSTLITGCYATTFGMDNHRRRWDTPAGIFYPERLRKAGYYCTNNSKTDYNTTRDHKAMWDECTAAATYNSAARKEGQPFFAVFNANMTHMSRLTSITLEGRRDFSLEGLDPAALHLPPHVPDMPAVRSDYAFHLEGVQDVDQWVKIFLDDLETRGLADDTIIIFNSDHGGCLPRGKGFAYESGLRVPLIVYLPPKFQALAPYQPGTSTDRLVGFVDIAPTLLSLIGLEPPETMQGRAFMGNYEDAPRTLQFAFRTNQEKHYAPSRAVTDGRWKYIRSYLPEKPDGLRNAFQWKMPSNLAWDQYAVDHKTPERAAEHPEWLQPYRSNPPEMLFDLKADPYELNNLSDHPQHIQTLEKMRCAVADHIRESNDLGFFPPTTKIKAKGVALYDWVRSTHYDLDALCEAAETASRPTLADQKKLTDYLGSPHSEIRFWGANGLGILGLCPAELKRLVNDPDPSVAAAAAMSCVLGGFPKRGMSAILNGLNKNKGEQQDPFYSVLETLSWHPAQRATLQHYRAKIQAVGGFPAKSLAINFGEIKAQQLFSSSAKKKGITVNRTRRPLIPVP